MRTVRSTLIIAALVMVLSPALASFAHASGDASVKGIRYRTANGYTRVVIDLSGRTDFSESTLKSPDRLFIDLEGSLGSGFERNLEVNDGLLKGIRAAQFNRKTVRVVLDLTKLGNYRVFSVEEPYRLVVDVYGDNAAPKHEAGESQDEGLGGIEKPSVKRVVIDAGHGGRDPGATGNGLMEKDITLDVAKRVKKLLDGQGGYEVYLTRDRDEYLSLESRTMMANKKHADLFISIHTNAHSNRNVRGIETYYLNYTNNESALKVAARENMISLRRMKKARSERDIILASLTLSNNVNESVRLAGLVQNTTVSRLEQKYSSVRSLGVKYALFYVLVGAKMPSVLFEVAFITNPNEARMLKTGSYREQLALGIANGIDKYFDTMPPEQKVAMR